MTINDYSEQFSSIYDNIYQHRDINKEANDAFELLDLNLNNNLEVLDFGCGTGSHSLAIASKGINVLGFDVSPFMIERALAKKITGKIDNIKFTTSPSFDKCDYCKTSKFQGVVSFFNVINCLSSVGEISYNLQCIKNKMIKGAKFLIEVWNGSAVLDKKPQQKISDSKEIIRIITPEVDTIGQTCILKYQIFNMDKTNNRFTETQSTHKLLFLTPIHYEHIFDLVGFKILSRFPKNNFSSEITHKDWYITYILQNF